MPLNCPISSPGDCDNCPWLSDDKCLADKQGGTPISDILTTNERLARLEKEERELRFYLKNLIITITEELDEFREKL